MSSLWVLGLGASVGYMMFKRQVCTERLTEAVKRHEKGLRPPGTGPDGATVLEIAQTKKAKDNTTYDESKTFSEGLPKADRQQILSDQQKLASEAVAFDAQADPLGQGTQIQGVYCELVGSA